jgi:bifunctional DNA-binding transcriptional regulator/antitoxin component of YhaV-PrlF toxin-antitoxin module
MERNRRVKFGKVKIQKLNRIALPTSILENLELNIGDEIELLLDIDKGEIIVRENEN